MLNSLNIYEEKHDQELEHIVIDNAQKLRDIQEMDRVLGREPRYTKSLHQPIERLVFSFFKDRHRSQTGYCI